MTTSFRFAVRTTIAAAALTLAAATPAFALTTGSVNCAASATTIAQPGYVSCLGNFTGNMDLQLNGPDGVFAAINSGFSLNTNEYYSSEEFTDAGNPFSQHEGDNDDGILNFDHAQTGKFVIGIKQANAFSLYLFDASNITGGLSQIAIDGNGVKTNSGIDISHAGYFGTPTTPIPEPETYAMLLGGLGLLASVARGRKTEKIS
jgi:PEP-CTERM motif